MKGDKIMEISVYRKRLLAVLFMTAFTVTGVFAHTPILYVEDNGDGTVFVQGGFSNGASAAGVQIYVKSIKTGETLWEGKLPDISEMDLEMPGEAYTITFDAGPGHVVTKEGPVPEGGFGKSESSLNDESAESASGKESSSADSSSEVSVDWTPQDTAAAMPDTGTPFVSIIALIVSLVNMCLLIVLLRKK